MVWRMLLEKPVYECSVMSFNFLAHQLFVPFLYSNWYNLFIIQYRITGFFCGCKFLRFVSKIGTCNFCDFIFCDFTPLQSDFYSLHYMRKLRVTLNTPLFMSMCQAHFPLYWTHRLITQAETPVPCSWEQKVIGPGMTQAVGSHSSWF